VGRTGASKKRAAPLDEALLQADRLYDEAPIGLCVLDRELRFRRVNRYFLSFSGQSAAAFLGKTVEEVSPATAVQSRKIFRQLVRTGQPILDIEFRGDTSTMPGEEHSWLAHWHPIKDARGRVVAANIAFKERSALFRANADSAWLLAERERERRYLATILEQMPVGAIIVESPSGRTLFGNKESARIFRHPFRHAEAVPDYAAWKILRADGSALPPAEYPLARAVLRGETVKGEELIIERGDGSRGIIRANAAPIRQGKRETAAAVVTFFDITEQRRVLEALRESEAKFRHVAENSPFGLGAYDARGRITFLNPRLTEIVGYRLQEVPRLDVWFRRAYPDAEYRREVEASWAADIERVDRGELRHSPVRVYRFRCRDGTVKDLEITFALGDRLTYAIFNDVTERQAAEREARRLTQQLEQLVEERTAALARANRELREEIAERRKLQCDLIAVAEREQRRLGEALHDDLGQQLAGVGLMTAVLERQLRAERHPKAETLEKLGEHLRQAVSSTRDLAKGFYPVVLEQGGLLLSLKDLAATTQAGSRVECTVRHRPSFRFAEAAAIHLYRIAQEAVHNAVRHASPTRISIELTASRGVSVLRVVNDGRAFVPKRRATGLGLQFVRHRAELIGASVTIAASPGGGCEVVCTLPARVKG